MARPRETLKLAERRTKVGKLYLQGLPQHVIGQQLGVTQATISGDLKALREQWRAEAFADVDAVKSRELARIDEIEAEAWGQWQRSKLPAQERSNGYSEKGAFRKRTIKGQCGDPRYLAIVMSCVKQRCDIMGLNAPVKQEHSHTFADERTITEAEKRLGIGYRPWSLPGEAPAETPEVSPDPEVAT